MSKDEKGKDWCVGVAAMLAGFTGLAGVFLVVLAVIFSSAPAAVWGAIAGLALAIVAQVSLRSALSVGRSRSAKSAMDDAKAIAAEVGNAELKAIVLTHLALHRANLPRPAREEILKSIDLSKVGHR